MPRSFDEYTSQDWRRIRPLVERYKAARPLVRGAWHVRRPAIVGDTAGVGRKIKDRRVLITIAFDDPQVVCWQSDLIQRHIRDCIHILIDNSSDNEAAQQIEAEANARGLSYLRLASNPWRSSRGHALAMNWAWRNLVRPGAPEAFGFVDHDLFPLEDTDPFEPLRAAPFWGRINECGRRWYLWAGFCFFRFDAVKRSNLEFQPDWWTRPTLDSGGYNWHRLYRHIDRGAIPSIAARREAVLPEHPIEACYFERLGSWLHEGRFGGPQTKVSLRPRKREMLALRLAPFLNPERALLLSHETAMKVLRY